MSYIPKTNKPKEKIDFKLSIKSILIAVPIVAIVQILLTVLLEKLGLNYEFDVHNEARMHLWKKENENKNIDQYKNSEDAIDQWIATVHAIGITKENNQIKVYAPYGLSDIFSKTIRPIKHKANSKELYDRKVSSWKNRFNNLTIVEW